MCYLNTNFLLKVDWFFLWFDHFPKTKLFWYLILSTRPDIEDMNTAQSVTKKADTMCSDTMPLLMSSVLTFLTFVIACITLTKMNWGKNVLVRLIIYLPIKPYFRNGNRLLDGHINNGIKLCRQLEQDRAVHLLFSVQSPTSSKYYIEYLKSFFMFSKILHRHILSLLIFV